MSRGKRGKLETKVLKCRPLTDEKGKYIPYCDFGYHQGVIKTPEICEERNCIHFQKLYLKGRWVDFPKF